VADQQQQRERHRRDFQRRHPARGLDPALDQRFELLRQLNKQTSCPLIVNGLSPFRSGVPVCRTTVVTTATGMCHLARMLSH